MTEPKHTLYGTAVLEFFHEAVNAFEALRDASDGFSLNAIIGCLCQNENLTLCLVGKVGLYAFVECPNDIVDKALLVDLVVLKGKETLCRHQCDGGQHN